MSTQRRSFTKEFKVVAVSTNTNSFGLHNVVMVARDGEAWQAGASYLNVPKQGAMVTLTFRESANGIGLEKYPQFPFSCEIPERKEDANPILLKEFFPEG